MAEHKPKIHVSDNTTTVWATCPCGWESSFFTVEDDGQKAMEAVRKAVDNHEAPPPEPDLMKLNEEPPASEEPERG